MNGHKHTANVNINIQRQRGHIWANLRGIAKNEAVSRATNAFSAELSFGRHENIQLVSKYHPTPLGRTFQTVSNFAVRANYLENRVAEVSWRLLKRHIRSCPIKSYSTKERSFFHSAKRRSLASASYSDPSQTRLTLRSHTRFPAFAKTMEQFFSHIR